MKRTSFSEKKFVKRRILRATGILLLILIVVILGFIGIKVWENSSYNGSIDDGHASTVPTPQIVHDTITYDGKEYVKKNGLETVLVLGLDKFEGDVSSESYNNNLQSDFLMLFVIDHNSKTYSSLHINRDTMAEIDILGLTNEKIGSVNAQLALAHTYGDGGSSSCRNVVNAVSRVLEDIEIEHYISVTMDTVPLINDKLGGVEVTVLDDFTGIDNSLVKGDTVTLTGEHALTYVRTRYGMEDSTNSTRMVRQRQYLEALSSKAKTAVSEDNSIVVDILEALNSKMVSDYDIVELNDIANCLAQYDYVNIYSLEGENVMGEKYIEFYPHEDSVKKAIIDLFYCPATIAKN